MTELCRHKGCRAPATHVPVISVPLKGALIGLHKPVELIVNIPACLFHLRRLTPPKLLKPQAREFITKLAAVKSTLKPDFDQASILSTPLDKFRRQVNGKA